ncbi:hypothetical protein PVK06_047131 [Gossypium arboreum]|uniref:Uncharacterized protein n=1 Tax=Gossypium arboreum TaxID=29729 RepID=A0ABR0MCV1_GOSAR|nr:hypothetical protein PVK06_047131 [Gossypium arboreum]
MPPRCVNVRASAQEDGTSSAPPISPCRANIPDEGVGPLMEAMVEAFQQIASANPAPISVNRGLSFEHLRALGGCGMERRRRKINICGIHGNYGI